MCFIIVCVCVIQRYIFFLNQYNCKILQLWKHLNTKNTIKHISYYIKYKYQIDLLTRKQYKPPILKIKSFSPVLWILIIHLKCVEKDAGVIQNLKNIISFKHL